MAFCGLNRIRFKACPAFGETNLLTEHDLTLLNPKTHAQHHTPPGSTRRFYPKQVRSGFPLPQVIEAMAAKFKLPELTD